MIVSTAELTGLAAISGSGWLPGVPATAGAAQAAAAMEGLRAKGVVGEDGRVTRFGMLPVRVVEQYWRADRHVFVNQLKASLNDDGAVTVFHPVGDSWKVSRMAPQTLMVALLEAYPWLCIGGTRVPAGPWRPLTLKQWEDGRGTDSDQVLVVRDTCVSGAMSTTVAFDLRQGCGFAYLFGSGEGRTLPVWQIRSEIAGRLGCIPDGMDAHG